MSASSDVERAAALLAQALGSLRTDLARRKLSLTRTVVAADKATQAADILRDVVRKLEDTRPRVQS
jgi:hypothetical protein